MWWLLVVEMVIVSVLKGFFLSLNHFSLYLWFSLFHFFFLYFFFIFYSSFDLLFSSLNQSNLFSQLNLHFFSFFFFITFEFPFLVFFPLLLLLCFPFFGSIMLSSWLKLFFSFLFISQHLFFLSWHPLFHSSPTYRQ